MLIPTLWLADFNHPHIDCCINFIIWFFLMTKGLVCMLLIFEGIFNSLFGRYPFLIPPRPQSVEPQRKTIHQVRFTDFYNYKQIKFELFLIFTLNVAPIFVLMCGQQNL